MDNKNQSAFPPSSECIKKMNEGYHEPSGMTKLEYFTLQIYKSYILNTDFIPKFKIEEYLGLAENTYNHYEHWHKYIIKKSIEEAKFLLSELGKEQN